jgi:hypothetical protein
MTKFIETRDGEHINAALIECLSWSDEKGCYVAETTSGNKHYVNEDDFINGTATIVPNALNKKAYRVRATPEGVEVEPITLIGWIVKNSFIHGPRPIFSIDLNGRSEEVFAIEASDGLFELHYEIYEPNGCSFFIGSLDDAREYVTSKEK